MTKVAKCAGYIVIIMMMTTAKTALGRSGPTECCQLFIGIKAKNKNKNKK